MADIKEHINDYTLEEDKLSSNESILRDLLIARLRSSGIEVITDKKEVKELLDTYQALGNSDIRFQSVFHGSGVNFDHFDHSHMGEGEGAQSHGWGTYVTLDEKVGKKYASKSDQATGLKRSELEFEIHRAEDQLSFLRGEVKASKEKELKKLKAELNNLERSRFLYTVDIPDNTGYNYLEEDGPLSEEQQKMLAEESEKEGFGDYTLSYRDEKGNLMLNADASNGRWLYRNELTRVLGSPKAASEFLSRAGFKGIHYNGREDGDCYVIFDDKDLNIEDKIKFFKTSNGDAYGFTLNNKIYVDIDIANSETPIHEYTHLWASALRAGNEHEWNNVVALMKQQTDLWDSVKSRYPQLSSDDDIADEVLATYSGQRGAKLLREQMKGIMGADEEKATSMLSAFEEAIMRFWHEVEEMLHIHYISSEQVADQIMSDMLHGVNPSEVKKEAFVRQEFESFVDSNKNFNERLSSLKEDSHQKDQRLRLGYASTFLREGGLGDGMIFLQYNKVLRKSSENYENNYPYNIASLRNLPMAIAYPISVFENTNDKKAGSTILTELSDGNHNFIVAVKTVSEHRANGVNMEINDITTLFPKDEKGIVNWYNTGKATNIDKKKALRFISSLQTHSGNEINSEELSSAANIINKFEKAKYQEDNFDKTFKEVSSDRRYVEAVASGHIEEARQMLAERAKSMGYLSTDYQGKDSWSAPVAEIEPTDFENKEVLQQMIDDFGGEANVYGIINGIQGHDSDYYYNPDAVGFHGQAANETAEILRRLRDEHASGDTQVDIYRVVPNMVKGSQIMQGDWVALSKAYCEDLGKHKYGEGNYHVIESKAPIKSLWMGDEDMREFGFDDGQGDVEKNVLHNRKLLDITYDDQGQLIPLSQRYNERDEDIRFQLHNDKQNKVMNNNKDKISPSAQNAIEAFTDHMVKVMEDMKRSDWKKGWSVGSNGMFGLPMNIKGFTYSGVNAMITSFHTLDNGYTAPVYMTFKQASKYGCHVKEGERAIPIINVGVHKYYNRKLISDEEYDQLPDEEKDKVYKIHHITSFAEFNIDQTNLKEVNKDLYDKLVSLFHGEAPSYDREGMFASPELDRMLKNQEWVCSVDCSHVTDSAYYRPSTDQIVIPMKEQFKVSDTPDEIFKDGQEFYSTALHEMAHSTGHQSRLNRPVSSFCIKEYAKEELIAELTSALVCSALGFDKRINRDSAAYLVSWVHKLSRDPNYIREVMPQVNRASKMVLENIDKQRVALGLQPLMRSGEIDLDTIQAKDPVKQQQEVVKNKEAHPLSEEAQHTVDDTLDKDAIADGYVNNMEKQWDEVVKMYGQDENLFDQLAAAASGQPLDSVKHTDKFDIVHDFINQFGGKKELGAETETTTGALYNSHSVAQLNLNDGSILEVNDYSKAFDDSVKDVQELSHVRDGAIIDSARKEIGGVNQNVNQETLNNLWSAFAGSSPMNRSQEQHVVGNQANFDLNKLYNEGIEKSRTDAMRAHILDNEMHSESDNKQVAASNEEKAVVKPSVDNSEQSYYVEVASYMNSEDVQMFDEIKANESSLLTLASQCDPGEAIDQEYTYKTPYQSKGDAVIAENDKYAVVFNNEFGSNSYDVLRKVSESDIRLNIDRYGLSQDASEDVIEIANNYEAEKIAKKIKTEKANGEQMTPHEDSDIRTNVTDTAKQIVASDNVPMEQAEKEAKNIADEQVHKEFHQQQDKLHAEEEKQQQVGKQEQEKKRREQEQAKKQKVMNPKLYDVFGMKDGLRELVKEGLGIVAAATFVERNSERYQRKGYDYLISMPHVEETLEKSQSKDADMAKEQSPQEQEGKERKNPYQPLFEGSREEAQQIVDALKEYMNDPDITIAYDEILRDATLYGETPLYADKEWYKKYAEGKSDSEIAGLYRRALATLETIPEQQATVKSISDNTVENDQEQEDMNKKEEQLKQQAKKEEELHKEESSMSEPVTPKASSDDSVKEKTEQTEQTKEPSSKEDEKIVNTAAVHAGLLLGALESAKEGIWLNPHGKHGAALLEPGKMITGYNRLMMDLFADKNHYKTNVFTYYDYAKKEEMPVKQGQTSLPIDWTRWDYENVATKEVITKEQYAELTPDKQQDYARHSTKQTRHLYNIDQTAMAGTKVADYSKLVKGNGSKFEDIPELPTDKNFLNLTNRLHGKHKDCTIILGEGDKNFAYGTHAEKVGSVMGVPVQSKDIDGKKVSYIEFPHTALDTVLPKMIGFHNKVALCSNVLESKFEASNNISKNSVRDAATVADKVSRKAGFTLERVLDDVPVSYDKEKDVITYSGNNARQPGRENLAAVEKANDIYRAVVEATGRENRLDREARFNMLPEDNAKYEKLVQELSSGVLMAAHGLPAIISKENRDLIPYWEREIKENSKMMAVLEKDVNNSIEQIEKHLLGQEVDYAKVRGARPALFDAHDYTVASKMAQLPNVETKEFVIIRNAEKTAADVILPEGAALPGMNKDRITHALAKENIKEVHFYNAGGAQGLYKDNDYFAGKTATLTKLKQWDLLPRHVVDISSQYLNVEKKPLIERFRAISDDSHRWAFNIKVKGEGQFSVYPAKEYLNAYFTARNNPNKVEKAKMMSSLAQRYYAVAQAHPEVKKELIMPKVPEGVDMSKLTGTTIGRDKDDHSKVFVQSTIDGAFHKEPITMAQYQRMWLADDMQDYKNAIAANAFASIIKSAKAQQEADEGLKIVDNSNVKDVVGHSEKQDQGHSESHSDGGSSDSDDKSESEGQGVGDASSKQADKDKSEEENKSRGFHM